MAPHLLHDVTVNPHHLELGLVRRPGRLVLHVAGEIDLSNVESLRRWMREAVGGDEPLVVVDMTRVAFIDGRGVNLLAETARSLRTTGREFAVVTPERGMIAHLLEITGLDKTVPTRSAVDDVG